MVPHQHGCWQRGQASEVQRQAEPEVVHPKAALNTAGGCDVCEQPLLVTACTMLLCVRRSLLSCLSRCFGYHSSRHYFPCQHCIKFEQLSRLSTCAATKWHVIQSHLSTCAACTVASHLVHLVYSVCVLEGSDTHACQPVLGGCAIQACRIAWYLLSTVHACFILFFAQSLLNAWLLVLTLH